VIDDVGTINLVRARDLMESIPVCTVIQEQAGNEDMIGRDCLLSSLDLEPTHGDDELALLYSAFDFYAVHEVDAGFQSTAEVGDYSCPFYIPAVRFNCAAWRQISAERSHGHQQPGQVGRAERFVGTERRLISQMS
jgi:hypothetical protein